MTEIKTVYYLTHKDTKRRLKYYRTLAGARIAQRLRNSHLGFHTRVNRHIEDGTEVEICLNFDSKSVPATWIIEEDFIEQENLY